MPKKNAQKGTKHDFCALCDRLQVLTFHHLIPRATHNKQWCKRLFTKEQQLHQGIMICQMCHSTLHNFFDEKTLAKLLHSKELICSNEKMQRYLYWARKQH
jgi:hypothetical protein